MGKQSPDRKDLLTSAAEITGVAIGSVFITQVITPLEQLVFAGFTEGEIFVRTWVVIAFIGMLALLASKMLPSGKS